MSERGDAWSVEAEEEWVTALLAAMPVNPAVAAFFRAIEPTDLPFVRLLLGDLTAANNDDGTPTYAWTNKP